MIDLIKQDVLRKYQDKPHRLDHIFGVRDTALAFGRQYHLDLDKLEIASLLHDITKYDDIEQQIQEILDHYPNGSDIIRQYNPQILHAFTAKLYAMNTYGITDPDILNAITSHTVGRPNMSLYEEVVFLSDYIEPTRTYRSCVETREIAKTNFTQAIYKAIDDSIRHQEQLHNKVPKAAYLARAYYKNKLEEQKWTK